MHPTELAAIRGLALETLWGYMNRERKLTSDPLSVYMETSLLRLYLANRGRPVTAEQLAGEILTYLRDIGAVEYRTVQPDGPLGEVLLFWRISHNGMQLLEGTRSDPGVRF